MNDSVLNRFYSDIEILEDKFWNVFPSIEEINDFDDRIKICCEHNILCSLRLDSASSEYFTEKFSAHKDLVCSYLQERVEQTNNNILKAKYYYALSLLVSRSSFHIKSIDCYYLVMSSKRLDCYSTVIVDSIESIIAISTKRKHRVDNLRGYVKDIVCDDSTCDKLRFCVLNISEKYHLFKPSHKETSELLKLLIEVAKRQSDNAYKERCLELALIYARKYQNNIAYKSLISQVYEQLGDCQISLLIPDDEKNLMIPHQNETMLKRAINYYKQAGNHKKLNYAAKLFRENSSKLVFPTIRIQGEITEEVLDAMERTIDTFSTISSSVASYCLVYGCDFSIPSQVVNNITNGMQNPEYLKDFVEEQKDINNNSKIIEHNHYMCFWSYNVMIDNIYLPLILHSIIQSMEKKRLSYRRLYNFLNQHTSFGVERIRHINGIQITYTWLSMIDIGLEEFFKQIKAIKQGKAPDWRVCVDVLVPKFEGILREILQINGANLTIFKDDGSHTATLEKLIRFDDQNDSSKIKEAFYKTFDDDDLMLFQYVFTNIANCLNVRNNVAHGFYTPVHYTEKVATLVVFCVLRLAKFKDAE